MKKVSIITLGCAKNQNDTENLAGLLKKEGLTIEPDAAQADTIVVHTCSFIEAAKKESIQTILEAAQLKNGNKKHRPRIIADFCCIYSYIIFQQ